MRIGVIDIGSNSIKLLIADTGSTLAVRYQLTWETRISESTKQEETLLSQEAMEAGVATVKKLMDEAKSYDPMKMCIVATSAVRDAKNRETFIGMIKEATGHDLTVLSGEEEAAYIAEGICTDPVVSNFTEFSMCDLGGGSLECIQMKKKKIQQKVSLQLGAVRLSTQFLSDPRGPISEEEKNAIISHVRNTLIESPFTFSKNNQAIAGTGGALNICRAIRAHWLGKTIQTIDPFISLEFLKYLYNEIAAVPIEDRIKVHELPEARADILPTALLVLITLAECANMEGYTHSFHNLRFGIAAQMHAESL